MPGKLTDLVKRFTMLRLMKLVVLAIAALPSFASKTCDDLESIYLKKGYLPAHIRGDYCLQGCQFLEVTCHRVSDVHFASVLAAVGGFRVWVEGLLDDDSALSQVPEITVDEITIDAWLDIIARVWPLMFSIVPVLLNQWKVKAYWPSVTIMSFSLIFMFALGAEWPILLYNVLITYLCLIHSGNSGYLVESIGTMLAMIGAVLSIFITSIYWHIFVVVLVLMGFFGYLYWLFFKKRAGSSAAMVVVIAQILVLLAQLKFVREFMACRNLIGVVLEMCLNAVIPDGTSSYWAVNSFKLAKLLAFKFLITDNRFVVFLVAYMVQFVLFVAFRAALGTYYIHMLRYKLDVKNLVAGAYVYAVDFFGPAKCLFRVLFHYETYQSRRLFYAVVGLALGCFELRYASEFAMLRIIMSSFDMIFVQSIYIRTTHYLQFDVDMMQVAFPQQGSFPWLKLEMLSEIASHTGRIVVDKGDKTVQGICCRLNSGGRSILYTVKHVIKGAKLIQYFGKTVSSPEFEDVTKASDTMVSMKCEEANAPEIELLTRSEVFDVEALLFINVGEDSGNFICFVPTFKVEKGALYASVDLKRGDSGGPCFAVLSSGELRLCGTVSRGNPRHGGGNIVSFCYHDENLSDDSSHEGELESVKAFNAVRKVRFRSDPPNLNQNALTVRTFLEVHRDLFVRMADWDHHLRWQDVDRTPDEILSSWVVLDAQRKAPEPADDDAGVDDDHGGGDSKSKKKRKSRKDRAAQKRALEVLLLLPPLLKTAYSEIDSANIFNAVARGDCPEFDGCEVIGSREIGGWIMSDEPGSGWNAMSVV